MYPNPSRRELLAWARERRRAARAAQYELARADAIWHLRGVQLLLVQLRRSRRQDAMTVFYETAEGVCAGQLIEDFGTSALVLLESENGQAVRGNVYSLVSIGA